MQITLKQAINHKAREYEQRQQIDLPDAEAERLIHLGLAEAVKPAVTKTKEQ